MTTKLDRSRVLHAHTWEVLSDRATTKLIDECNASHDGVAYAHFVNDAEGHYWEAGHTDDYLNRFEVRIAVPLLTEKSTIQELAQLLERRVLNLTGLRFDRGTKLVEARVSNADGYRREQDTAAWRAINLAIFNLERDE